MELGLSVIAPCLNEEENVGPLAERALATFDRMSGPCELVWREAVTCRKPGRRSA